VPTTSSSDNSQSPSARPPRRLPAQRDGDLVGDGVCVLVIADKLGVAQPTATAHMQAIARAGPVTPKRLGQWTFDKRDEAALAALKQTIAEDL
jgi:DNA-binding transcriptional ArsR family regulator